MKKFALPPASPLLLMVLSFAWPEPWRTLGLAVGLAFLWLCATPLVGLFLLRRLRRYPAVDLESLDLDAARDAIVVLDGGRYMRAVGGASVKPETLERLRLAAELRRKTGLPILASGDGAGLLMGRVLEEDFSVAARWLEVESRNTQENADLSAALLQADGYGRVLLVTHAWHMPRSVRAFKRAGLEVIPAPLGGMGPDRQELRWMALVPSAGGLFGTWRALHEGVGLVWYALRYRR